MKRLLLPALFILFLVKYGFSQNAGVGLKEDVYTIAFYNLENLFDTLDDPKTSDSEFLPAGKKSWNVKRYFLKLKNESNVIRAIDSANFPVIVGLSEIENQAVLEDLVKQKAIKSAKYKIIHYESPDPRGIDVGLLYRPDVFTLLKATAIPVYYDSIYKKQKTREILYVKGIFDGTDTLHVFVNHWKSRAGGVSATEPKRICYAKVLRSVIDSILNVNPEAKIISMGDYNDEPGDVSIKTYLGAAEPVKTPVNNKIYNLMIPIQASGKGTHFFSGDWNVLDQMIVSGAFLNPKSDIHVDEEGAKVFNPDWVAMPYKKTEEKIPLPTYDGSTYFGGYSDHFSIYVRIKINK